MSLTRTWHMQMMALFDEFALRFPTSMDFLDSSQLFFCIIPLHKYSVFCKRLTENFTYILYINIVVTKMICCATS